MTLRRLQDSAIRIAADRRLPFRAEKIDTTG